MGIAHFSHHFPYHFYSVDALLADTGTQGAACFYHNCQDLDECLAYACWLSAKSEGATKILFLAKHMLSRAIIIR